jgi:hypothetical protein
MSPPSPSSSKPSSSSEPQLTASGSSVGVIPSSPPQPSSSLNLEAASFSPSHSPSGGVSKELHEWLLFSLSSSEGRSPTSHGKSQASFADTMCQKGKEPVVDPAPAAAHGSSLASGFGSLRVQDRLSLEPHGRGGWGFMADVCRAHQACPHLESEVAIQVEEGWQVNTHRKQGHPPPPTTMLLPLLRLIARCYLIWSGSVSTTCAQIM